MGLAALFALIAVLAGVFHFASGSPWSEFGAHPDEAAHFVTGLMVRDYFTSGFHEGPLRYAEEYYRHYPKIGLGVWPPCFYIVQAGWTLISPAGGPAEGVLRLMYVLGVGLGLVTGARIWREFGWVLGATGATILIALPLVQMYSNMVMAEMLSALLMFGAVGYFAQFIDGRAGGSSSSSRSSSREDWRGAAGFGICAGLAMMTKGTGVALALVPGLAMVLTGRYDLLKRRSLWVAAAAAGAIGGPWTWHFRNQGRGGWEEPSPSLHFTKMAASYYGREMCVALGGLLTVLALAGAVSLFLPILSKGRKPAIAVCSLALALGVWAFQCLAPVGLEARHLTPATPALVVLAITGLRALTQRWTGCTGRTGAGPIFAGGLMTVFFAWPAVFHPGGPLPAFPGFPGFPGYGSIGNRIEVSPFRIARKQWGGFEPVAIAAMAAMARGPAERMLIASDARGEGMFIAEVAARDPHRPSFTIERASKILASSTWSGSGYESLYRTPGEVREALAKAGIDLVVTDESPATLSAHEKLLLQLMKGAPVIMRSTAVRDGKQSGAITLSLLPK